MKRAPADRVTPGPFPPGIIHARITPDTRSQLAFPQEPDTPASQQDRCQLSQASLARPASPTGSLMATTTELNASVELTAANWALNKLRARQVSDGEGTTGVKATRRGGLGAGWKGTKSKLDSRSSSRTYVG